MKPVRLGWFIALITFFLDQGSKLGVMRFFNISARDILSLAPNVDLFPQGMSHSLLPCFNLTVTWNKGISYGLFQQETATGRWLLAGLSILAIILLSYWLRSSKRQIITLAFGLIIGGALGNAVDRMAYGAVFDFAHFHLSDFSWYVFNIADAAIVAGVIGFIYDALFPLKSDKTEISSS